jgi:hypothetical protein
MKVGVIGSRNLQINNLEKYLPINVTEIVSGGAKGVDSCAKNYAQTHNIKLTEFLPEYDRYSKSAPIKRNLQIIDYADMVIAFGDGKSNGTKNVIDTCNKKGVKIVVHEIEKNIKTE